jgi:putative cardiolipin synthase
LRIQALASIVLLAGCAQLPQLPAVPDVVAHGPAQGGALAELIGPAESARPGESGFRLLTKGTEAFVVRMQSARHASRSLDIQT